jgi:AraC-like DNA-binding protein
MTLGADQLTKRAKDRGGRAITEPSIPAHVLRVYIDTMARLGYSVEPQLAEVGIDRLGLERDPDARVLCAIWLPIFQRELQRRPMKNPLVRLAAATPIGSFPLIDYLMVTSDSIGAAIRQLIRYLGLVDHPHVIEINESEDPIRVVFVSRDGPPTDEYGIALTLHHLREEAGEHFRPSYISFQHMPEDLTDMEEVLGCPVHGRAEWAGFALSRSTWNLPLQRRDPILANLLRQQADETIARLPKTDDLLFDVRREVASRVAGGDTRIQSVARVLATSVRSLQRRLADAGSSYQQLVDAARKDAAERYLATSSFSVGEIAYLLGYSEAAAFNRAFRRWHKSTPQAFRVQAQRRESGKDRLANLPPAVPRLGA